MKDTEETSRCLDCLSDLGNKASVAAAHAMVTNHDNYELTILVSHTSRFKLSDGLVLQVEQLAKSEAEH